MNVLIWAGNAMFVHTVLSLVGHPLLLLIVTDTGDAVELALLLVHLAPIECGALTIVVVFHGSVYGETVPAAPKLAESSSSCVLTSVPPTFVAVTLTVPATTPPAGEVTVQVGGGGPPAPSTYAPLSHGTTRVTYDEPYHGAPCGSEHSEVTFPVHDELRFIPLPATLASLELPLYLLDAMKP
jgi:hypothetical protein